MEHDYSKCDVCGITTGPDRLHIMIDNGRVTRHTYACRKHRYVMVEVAGGEKIRQTRSDIEIEALAHAFRFKELEVGWE